MQTVSRVLSSQVMSMPGQSKPTFFSKEHRLHAFAAPAFAAFGNATIHHADYS